MKRDRWLLLLLILAWALGAYLRFNDLRTAPNWYSDEGSNIVISAGMAHGELAYMAVGESSFINGHPHLYYSLLSVLFRIFGVDILWARVLSASLGLLALILLCPVVASVTDRRLAITATFLYAFYPGAVTFSRLGFTYSLLTPLYLLALYTLHRYLDQPRSRWVVVAALCAGLAIITDLAGAILPLFICLVLLFKRPAHLLLALPVVALPGLIWGLWMWSAAGDAFLFDLAFTLSRTGASFAVQIARLITYYHEAMIMDPWFLLGTLGLLLLPTRRGRGLLAGFYLPALVFTMRTVNIGGLGYYFLIPYHPFIAVGVASLVVQGVPFILRHLEGDMQSWLAGRIRRPAARRWLATLVNSLVLFLFILSPLLLGLYQASTSDSLPYTRLREAGAFASPETGTQAAQYINIHTADRDVVLTSPTIAWLIEAQAADFQLAVAASGQASYHFPDDIPPSRFRFDARLENASYVVLDPLWRGWASVTMPEVAEMVRTVESDWGLEATFGEFDVYRNPSQPGE